MANLVAQSYLTFNPADRQLLLDRFHHAQSPLRPTVQHSPLRIQSSPSRIQPSPLRIQSSPSRIQPSPLRHSPLQSSPLRVATTLESPSSQKSPIVSPSPSKPYNKENQSERLCKRRIDFPLQQQKPMKRTTVARRNERERNRVKLVNLGFATLREHVPHGKNKKKMSKVDTLRSAADYIRYLKRLLGDENALKGQAYRVDLRSPVDVVSTGYGSDCSSEHTTHDDDEYLDFSTWFK